MTKEISNWLKRYVNHKNTGFVIQVFWFIVFLLLVSWFVILSQANFFSVQTNVESARYLLSALVQSQAAILAIVISLTIIAIQFHASAYSPRIIKIFRESLGWLALFVSYGISIFYGLLVLKMIKSVDELHPSILSSITYLDMPLEWHISLAYALGCLTFLILILYLLSIINLFNPATIINRLAKDITKDRLLNEKEDPIQPILDIVHGSIMKYDIATARVGLKAVTDKVIDKIDSQSEKEISKFFCEHLERVYRLAISREDEEAAVEVVDNLKKFGSSTAENRLEDAAYKAISSLSLIGISAAEKEFEYITLMGTSNLGGIGLKATENGLERAATAAVSSLGEVGITAAGKGIENPTSTAVGNLEKIGSKTAEKGLVKATEWAVESLHAIGETAVEKELKGAISRVIMSLKTVGITAAKNNLKNATQKATRALVAVRMSATKKGFERVTEFVPSSLAELTLLNEEIVKIAIQNYESELKEEDRESFQKFMKLYEEELERLQAARETSD